MTTDYCMLRRPEFMQQMIQQRQLDLLLQCAYMEHSRTLARDMEYIQSKFCHPVTSNDKSMVPKGWYGSVRGAEFWSGPAIPCNTSKVTLT